MYSHESACNNMTWWYYHHTISSKIAHLLDAWSNVKSMQCEPTFACEGRHAGWNSSPVGEGIQGNVMSWKHMWKWCTAFNSGRTDVDKSSNPNAKEYPLQMLLSAGTDTLNWHHPKTRYYTVQCTQNCSQSTGLQKSVCMLDAKEPHRSQTSSYELFSHAFDTLMPLKKSRFCSALLQGLKHGLIMWHQQSKKYPWCGNIHHLPQQRKWKQHPQ